MNTAIRREKECRLRHKCPSDVEKGGQKIVLSKEKRYNIQRYPELCLNFEKGELSE